MLFVIKHDEIPLFDRITNGNRARGFSHKRLRAITSEK